MAVEQAPVVVNEDLCTACGICIQVCPKNVLELVEDLHVWTGSMCKVQRPEDCIRCKFCENACPHFAIDVADMGVELTFTDSKGNQVTKSK
jgi:2-oxoglutarate ferredoxin oxidoreductase subunit delta